MILSFALQAMLFQTHYKRECHIHGYQKGYNENDEIEIPAVPSLNNIQSCPKWEIIPHMPPNS